MGFQKVARLADIPKGGGLRVRIDEIDVGLFCVEDQVYAMENRCPHAGVPLSEGRLEGCVIYCRSHGWDFDVRTGFRPGESDGFPIPCFPVRIEDGDIFVDIAQPNNLGRRRRPPPAED